MSEWQFEIMPAACKQARYSSFTLRALKAIYLSVIRKIYVFHLCNFFFILVRILDFFWDGSQKLQNTMVFLPQGIFSKVSMHKYELAPFHPGAGDLRSFPNCLTRDITSAWVLRSKRAMLLDPISHFFSHTCRSPWWLNWFYVLFWFVFSWLFWTT